MSIGDDEPERKAAAYVRKEIPQLVKGVKMIKMISHPTIDEVSLQIEHLIHNIRSYIDSPTSFDLLYKLERPDTVKLETIVKAIEENNKKSETIKRLTSSEVCVSPQDIPVVGDGVIISGTHSVDYINEEVHENGIICLNGLDKFVIELPQPCSAEPPNPLDAALIQFEINFDKFRKLFSCANPSDFTVAFIDAYQDNKSVRSTVSECEKSSNKDNETIAISFLSNELPRFLQEHLLHPIHSRLIEALCSNKLRERIYHHVNSLISTNRSELFLLGHDCVELLNQIHEHLPAIFDSKFEQDQTLTTGMKQHYSVVD